MSPGPWYERLPHFKMGFTPSSGKELQSEYFVPRRNAVEAILAVERLRDHVSPHLMISELRTIDADELWMSPCYQQPSLAIHFTWKQDWEAVRKVLPMIERELAPFGVRPHWGKLFTLAPAHAAGALREVGRVQAAAGAARPQGQVPQRIPDRDSLPLNAAVSDVSSRERDSAGLETATSMT